MLSQRPAEMAFNGLRVNILSLANHMISLAAVVVSKRTYPKTAFCRKPDPDLDLPPLTCIMVHLGLSLSIAYQSVSFLMCLGSFKPYSPLQRFFLSGFSSVHP